MAAFLHGPQRGWQYANAFDYNPVTTPPFCDNVDQSVDDGCLLLSDDFLQYWLGAERFIEDGGTNSDGEPFPLAGSAGGPFDGVDWTLNGGDSADNHHPNAARGTTQSFLTTSSLQTIDEFPQFTSDAIATWQTGVAGAFSPHTGDYYVYSDRANISYKRLTRTIDLTALDPGTSSELAFAMSFDTEADWDFVFVEAHTLDEAPDDDWTTLPDQNGHTSQNLGDPAVGNSCSSGWHTDPNNEIHPFLAHYQTWNGADAACDPVGTTGVWNAASGRSTGWEDWSIDLSPYAGSQVEVSISYVSDWAVQGIGVFLDDITVSTEVGTESFETGLGAWTVAGPAPGSAINPSDWTRTIDVGFEEAAVDDDDADRCSVPHRLLRLRVRGHHVPGGAKRGDGPRDRLPVDGRIGPGLERTARRIHPERSRHQLRARRGPNDGRRGSDSYHLAMGAAASTLELGSGLTLSYAAHGDSGK